MNHRLVQILIGYLVVLLALTFLPLDGLDRVMPVELRLHAFSTIKYALRLGIHSGPFWVLIGNIVAFVPLGLLLPMISRRWTAPLVLLAGLGLSVAIEAGQYLISAALGFGYRAADIDDVIINVLGVAIGYLFFVIGFLASRRTRQPSA